MKRLIDSALIQWRNKSSKKPLVLLGARQTGKTTSLLKFGKDQYKNCIHVDFIKNKSFAGLFENDIEPNKILQQICALKKTSVIDNETLLILDEIQECEQAVMSLKYLASLMPKIDICVAGSMLGVYFARTQYSFPVGYVEILNMHPMNFEEFCLAIDEDSAYAFVKDSFAAKEKCNLHEHMLGLYYEYLMVGGMPEAVKEWANNKNIEKVKLVQDNINTGNIADISKYSTANNSSKIFACWESVPVQLARESSSSKFKWAEVSNGAKKSTHNNAIEWLKAAGIIDVVTQVKCLEDPLKIFENSSAFKVYMCDTGLLCNLLNAKREDFNTTGPRTAQFRGTIAENYVAQQLTSNNIKHYYWGVSSKAEVDFVISTKEGVIPVAVKSGTNTGSRSLKYSADKYKCPFSVKVTAKNFGFENNVYNVPLYAAELLG